MKMTTAASVPQLERNLACCYILATILGITTLSCTVVPWMHWMEILENCEQSGVYCGCILYGSETFNYFTGGSNRLCHFVVYASVPVIVTALVLAGYHGYRTWIVRKPADKMELNKMRSLPKNRRTGELIVNKSRQESGHAWSGADPQCVCWGPLAIFAAIIATLLFSQAVVLSDGYQKTCHEYRKHIVKTTESATAQIANVIYERIPCNAVYDFMDYLEPYTRSFRPMKDRDSRYPYMAERDRMRQGKIFTAVALQIAMGTVWLNCIIFVAIVVHYIKLARTSSRFMQCCC